MSVLYLDASALGRVLLAEPDAPAIRAALPCFRAHASSRLLTVELQRLAHRHARDASDLLAGVALIPVSDALLDAAARLAPAGLPTLDAIHLATALATRDTAAPASAIMTYDLALADAARQHQLAVIAPTG